jgi:hypothetical protein
MPNPKIRTYRIGDKFGPYIVTNEYTGQVYGTVLNVRCAKCGAEQTITLQCLLDVAKLTARGEDRNCKMCRHARPHTSSLCPKCFGMPHRRPKKTPCVCGESFKVDVIVFDPRASRNGCGQIEAGGTVHS